MEPERAQDQPPPAQQEAEHGAGSPADADPVVELRRLAAAVRTHLLWLRAGGIDGVPRPAQQVKRPAAQQAQRQADTPGSPPQEAGVFPWQAPQGGPAPPQAPPQREPVVHTAPLRPAPAHPPRPTAQRPAAAGLPDPLPMVGQAGLDLVREVLGNCQRCKLCHGRNSLVFGQGAAQPRLVFVGEGPGAEEDRTGLAFVGAAGDLLTKMIGAMGFTREQVYICNVVKCRPPGNRTPERDEMETCGPFLRGQLQALRPQVIVALGRTPTQFLLKTAAPLGKLRGRFASWEGIPVMPTYHPAYLLRLQRTEPPWRQTWDDLKMVMGELRKGEEGNAGDAGARPPASGLPDGEAAGTLAEDAE